MDAQAKATELKELNAKIVQIGEPLDRPEKITGQHLQDKNASHRACALHHH